MSPAIEETNSVIEYIENKLGYSGSSDKPNSTLHYLPPQPWPQN
jgi:hypothetical protein